jgi:hypothetical protein
LVSNSDIIIFSVFYIVKELESLKIRVQDHYFYYSYLADTLSIYQFLSLIIWNEHKYRM